MVADNKEVLSKADTHSALWKKLEEHLTDRLSILRAKNDGNLSVEETAKLRGRIAELKNILDLAKGPEKLVNADD